MASKNNRRFHEMQLTRVTGQVVLIASQNPGDGRRYWAELPDGRRLSHSLPWAQFREWCFGFVDGAEWKPEGALPHHRGIE